MCKIGKMKQLAADLVLLKNRAGELGLFATMYKIDDVTVRIGWEIDQQVKEKKVDKAKV